MGIRFVCKRGMGKSNFKFQNPRYCEGRQVEPLSERNIKKIIFISSLSVLFCFFTFKTISFFYSKKSSVHLKSESQSTEKTAKESSYVLPLLVNLKGEKGPQLAKVHVHITFNGNSLEKKSLPQGNQLEKHLLFILSGQSSKNLNRKKNQFEKQIRSQLNAFLSENLVNGVSIHTEMLN